MDRKIILKFSTDTGETYSITIPNTLETVSAQLIKEQMNMLIMLEVFSSTRGKLIGKESIQIVNTETVPLV